MQWTLCVRTLALSFALHPSVSVRGHALAMPSRVCPLSRVKSFLSTFHFSAHARARGS